MEKIRVGIRGAAGLLGTRLASAIAQTSDMRLVVGICKNDATLKRMLSRYEFGGPLIRGSLPEKLYLDEPEATVGQVNRSLGSQLFKPVTELELGEE